MSPFLGLETAAERRSSLVFRLRRFFHSLPHTTSLLTSLDIFFFTQADFFRLFPLMRSLVPGYLQLSIFSNFGVNELINQFVTIYFFSAFLLS